MTSAQDTKAITEHQVNSDPTDKLTGPLVSTDLYPFTLIQPDPNDEHTDPNDLRVGMHRYHFFTNRYEYEYFYLCTCRYRVPIPILLRFGLHESAINLEADFILSSADYV